MTSSPLLRYLERRNNPTRCATCDARAGDRVNGRLVVIYRSGDCQACDTDRRLRESGGPSASASYGGPPDGDAA